jgi:molybdenum-dependent DNA-binding transcriptional regulator ModE
MGRIDSVRRAIEQMTRRKKDPALGRDRGRKNRGGEGTGRGALMLAGEDGVGSVWSWRR